MDVSASVGILFLLFEQNGDWLRAQEVPMRQKTMAARCLSPFCSLLFSTARKDARMKIEPKKPVIAYRKTCPAKGTGLSHYILMNKKAK